MLVHLRNLETERRDREEAGAGATCKEFAEVKANFVLTGFDSQSTYDWMVELAVRVESTFGDTRGHRFDPPYLDTQTLGRTPACNIDCMNRYSTSHLVSYPLGPAA